MKVNDLIKQLKALKKLHGNIDVTTINGETGRTQSVLSLSAEYPPGANGCYDRTKPACSIILNNYKA
jgi:hypothetical protein